MKGCSCAQWSVRDLALALKDQHKDNKKIVVPMFQRGKRWDKAKESLFIDSLRRGYPVGTMLFYEKITNGSMTYVLVDGLQRGNTIKKYYENPSYFMDYDDSLVNVSVKIRDILHLQIGDENKIKDIIIEFLKTNSVLSQIQFFELAEPIVKTFYEEKDGYPFVVSVCNELNLAFKTIISDNDIIMKTEIPVVIYNGDERNLSDIFNRINSQSEPLSVYDIYAAVWPAEEKYHVINSKIVDAVIAKYDILAEDNFIVENYNGEELRRNKNLSAFEYLFGLGKYLSENYDALKFRTNLALDVVNTISFELVNACLNESDQISVLYKRLRQVEVNKFEYALSNALEFVTSCISVVTRFKGNTRKDRKPLHPKFLIISLVATVFKAMYKDLDFNDPCEEWKENALLYKKRILASYVYDILRNTWSEGGTKKIYTVIKEKRCLNEISGEAWNNALDTYFEGTMLRSEKVSVASPENEEYVFLNVIYLNQFTALDQLSDLHFDIEHIAPKEQMKRLIKNTNGRGLPISSIANLCYLPERVNRSKRERNFYQDDSYLKNLGMELYEIECKYSFTKKSDLAWMDQDYNGFDSYYELTDNYLNFCRNRFEKLKTLFYRSLDITYNPIESEIEGEFAEVEVEKVALKKGFASLCVPKLEEIFGTRLKGGRNEYISADGNTFIKLRTSKETYEGNRKKYWFAYIPLEEDVINKYQNVYFAYACKDENTIVIFTNEFMEDSKKYMNYTNKISSIYWHVNFYKDVDGSMTMTMPKSDNVVNNRHEMIIDRFVNKIL